jgi:hypothetical protein
MLYGRSLLAELKLAPTQKVIVREPILRHGRREFRPIYKSPNIGLTITSSTTADGPI